MCILPASRMLFGEVLAACLCTEWACHILCGAADTEGNRAPAQHALYCTLRSDWQPAGKLLSRLPCTLCCAQASAQTSTVISPGACYTCPEQRLGLPTPTDCHTQGGLASSHDKASAARTCPRCPRAGEELAQAALRDGEPSCQSSHTTMDQERPCRTCLRSALSSGRPVMAPEVQPVDNSPE